MIARNGSGTTVPAEGFAPRRGGSLTCVLALIVGLVTGMPWAVADGGEEFTNNMEGVAPLRSLLAHVHESYSGQVLEVELEREEYGQSGIWIYEVKLLAEKGNVLKLEYDATTLELLKIKGRREN